MMKKFVVSLLIVLIATIAFAEQKNITFGWDRNIEPDLAGYRLYSSTVSGNYSDPNSLTADIQDPNADIYELQEFDVTTDVYFVLTAYDTSGNESDYSNEVSIDGTPPNTPINFYINSVDSIIIQIGQ